MEPVTIVVLAGETLVVSEITKDQNTDAPDEEAAGKRSGIRTYPGENEAY